MVQAVRKIHFCAGHRVFNHESKCATIHGHNYNAFFYAEANDLDCIGRVIDFSVLKEKLGTWIDVNWDHTFILFKDDIETIELLGKAPGKKPLFIMETNPTAENMALFLIHKICPILFENTGVKVTRIVLYETENCFVEVSC